MKLQWGALPIELEISSVGRALYVICSETKGYR
jgi:hypothetical protein